MFMIDVREEEGCVWRQATVQPMLGDDCRNIDAACPLCVGRTKALEGKDAAATSAAAAEWMGDCCTDE